MKFLKIFVVIWFLLLFLILNLWAGEVILPEDFHKAYISGKITCKGKLLTKVQILAYNQDGGQAIAYNAFNGNYALGIGEGEWTVAATKEGYFTPKTIKVEVNAEETKEINIEMQKSTAFIEGIVVDESNRPLPNAWVVATPNMLGKRMTKSPNAFSPSQIYHSRCDSNGKFRLQTMKGSYLLIAAFPGYEMSPKNPIPKIPGMENIPEEYKHMVPTMAMMGIQVTVAEGETKKGVVIIMRPAKTHPGEEYPQKHRIIQEKPEAVVTMPNILVGKPKLTPNNVLHWTRTKKSNESPFYVVVRSTKNFNSKKKGKIKLFKLPKYFYGQPKREYYSLTDYTAVSGKTYWYAVYELGSSGPGPYSNSVMIKTR